MIQYDDNHLKAKDNLKEQSHVLNWFNELNEIEKQFLVKQANSINPKTISKMLEESLQSKPCDLSSIDQISSSRHIVFNDLTAQEKQFFFKIGNYVNFYLKNFVI